LIARQCTFLGEATRASVRRLGAQVAGNPPRLPRVEDLLDEEASRWVEPVAVGSLGDREDVLGAVHRSDSVQGTLGNEHAAAAEGGWRLGDRDGSKARHIADEPEALQEALRLD